MKRFLHVLDAASVLTGVTLIIANVLGGAEAQAAIPAAAAAIPGLGNVWGAMLGTTLVSFPVLRRVASEIAFDPAPLPEIEEVGSALLQVGLSQRVAAANLHMVELPQDAWQRLFATPHEVWGHFGPCYEDPAIRAQMRPFLRHRVEEAGRVLGHVA